MRTILLVIKQEIVTMLGKRSFWIMTFLFPLLIMVLTFGSQFMADRAMADAPPSVAPPPPIVNGENGENGGETAVPEPTWPEFSPSVSGYVDQAGIVQRHPASVAYEALHPFANETAAQSALAAGEIDRYYIIPSDYLTSGEIILVQAEFQIFGGAGAQSLLVYLINLNLIGDEMTAGLVNNPTALLQTRSIAIEPPADDGDAGAFVAAFTPTMFIFFFLILNSSGFMLQSVSREKENRTVEMLLVSLRPRDLMAGKMIGLSVIALLQMTVWVGGSFLILNRASAAADLIGSLDLPEGFLVWALLYFVFGYLVYASLMGAVGALAPSAREGGQLVFLIILPLLIPLWFNVAFIQAPNGGAATFMSLFPLTAPTSMITRMLMTDVPIWQLAASLIGLAATAYLFILLSARFFRADTLLSGAAISWRRVWAAVKS